MTLNERFEALLQNLPLVAILRGVTPEEVVAVGQVLYQAGFRIIEVPLNSPEPMLSIRRLRDSLPDDCIVGAGTVTSAAQVGEVQAAGGEIIVMPHADAAVIGAAKAAGLLCAPGIATPTEAFAALAAGADALKLFPAELLSPAVLAALRSVVPPETVMLPVGGITPDNMTPYLKAGARGFGLGSALYRAGQSLAQTEANAQRFAMAWQAVRRG
ncbi:MAG: 2-dehydro-3-deoxy-6-phosphogalactonate aldolase [Burkholderiaceae bacterium]|nr:2-dehydro-3-deoxy-6-phosphogalactonate aldolase [Burkholderiaceae bacterium]